MPRYEKGVSFLLSIVILISWAYSILFVRANIFAQIGAVISQSDQIKTITDLT